MARRAILPLLAAAMLAAACADQDGGESSGVRLRVGTAHGLGNASPGPSRLGGAAYYIQELLYEPVTSYAEVQGVEDGGVILMPKDAESGDVLRDALEFEGLETIETRDDGTLRCLFPSPKLAAEAARAFRTGRGVVAAGPFRLGSSGTTVTLHAQQQALSIDVIEIESLPATELWRRLHGRDIDVIPMLDEVHRERFEGLSSVRLLDLPMPAYQSMIFNPEAPAVADPAVRKKIVSMLDLDAIARIACGKAECKAPFWRNEAIAPGEDAAGAPFPSELSVLALASDSSLVLAAKVIRHQLRAEGVQVHLHLADLDAMLAREEIDYDVMLAPLPDTAVRAAAYIEVLTKPDRYGASRPQGDEATWARALAAELLAFPLYEQRSFAVVDGRFCGGEPERAARWTWLADLHPCEVASR